MHMLISQDAGGFCWRLLRRTATGADVVARGARPYPDERGCRHAVAELVGAAGAAMLVLQQPDGHWSWRVAGPDGHPVAESPAVFRDAASCGRALAELRAQLAQVPVG